VGSKILAQREALVLNLQLRRVVAVADSSQVSPALEAESVPADALRWEGALGDPAGGLRPRRQHELLDLALVGASTDAEHAPLAPAGAPRVHRQLHTLNTNQH
jgi:hypothetical protein